MTGSGMRLGLLEMAVMVRSCNSLAAPVLMPVKSTVWLPAFGGVRRVLMGVRVGGSLTGLTVRRKVLVAVARPSLTLRMIVAVPYWLRAGVMVTVRFVPLPPKTIFPSGTRLWFEEVPLTVK